MNFDCDQGTAIGTRAIGTIIVADAVMGIDNVLAIGGAAQGSMPLVVIGLAIPVPMMTLGIVARVEMGRAISGDHLVRRGGAQMDGGKNDRQRAVPGGVARRSSGRPWRDLRRHCR
jgi:hypothetical protein